MYVVESVEQVFETYMGPTVFLTLFLVCLIYCFCKVDENGRKRLLFVILLSIVLVFNNVSLRLVGKLTSDLTFYRFIWAVPVLLLIAWAGTKSVMERRKFWEKAAVLVLLIALFQGGTSTFLTEGSLSMPENIYNLPGDVIKVCDIIERHNDGDIENPVVAFDIECQVAARLYDPSLVWGIRRKAYLDYNNTDGYKNVKNRYKAEKTIIHAVNFGRKDEEQRLSNALQKRGIDYIVTYSSFEMDGYFAQLGYGLVESTGARSVYAREKNDLEVNQ